MIFFAKRKLRDAIKANDVVAVSNLVQECGRQILDRALPVRIDISDIERKMYLSSIAGGSPALIYALSLPGDNKNMLTALVNLGANMRTPSDEYGDYPYRHGYDNVLFYAAALGRVDILARWVEDFPELVREDDEGDTLLHVACRHYQLDCARFLVDRGYYTSERNDAGQSPLNLAAGQMDIVNMLLTVGQAKVRQQFEAQARAPAPVPPEPEPMWRVLPNGDIVRTEKNITLTDVFNFQTMERKRHYLCGETGSERVETCSFAQLEPAAHADVYAAWRALRRQSSTPVTHEDIARAIDPQRPQVLVKRKP